MVYQYSRGITLAQRLFLFFIFFPLCCQAQLTSKDSISIDSIKQVIKTTTNDTIKIKSLFALNHFIYRSDLEQSIKLLEEIISQSEKIVNKKALLNKDKEVAYFKKAIGICYLTIGKIYQKKNDYAKALQSYLQCFPIYENIGDLEGLANVELNIGRIYSEEKEYLKAIKYYNQSRKKYEEIRDTAKVAYCFMHLGGAYEVLKEYDKAISNHKQALQLTKEIGDNWNVGNILLNLAVVYDNFGEYNRALEYLYQALEIFEQLGHRSALVLSAISECLGKLGRYDEGIRYGKESLKIGNEKESYDVIFRASWSLYLNYKEIGRMGPALKMYETYIAALDSLENLENKKAAILFESERKALADSILNAEMQKVKDAQLAAQKAQNEKQQQRSWFLFFGLLGAVVFGIFLFKQKKKVEVEKKRSENLLLNILPAEIAQELKIKGKADARGFDLVSMLFTDFKGFTQASEKMSARELIEEINECFKAFDHICETYGIEKIKTIGDAYMAAGGIPVPSDTSVKNTVLAGLEMQAFISQRIQEKIAKNEIYFEMRLGIHTGPVVAGIVGVKKFQYDIWGDTVNTASRMESSGGIGKVNISEDTYNLIKDDDEFTFESRGKIEVKGKGEIEMFFVTNA